MVTQISLTKEDLQSAILSRIATGEGNAIHKTALAKSLGINERIVREVIVEMRHAGTPIIGSQKGYYLAESVEDIQKAREYLKSYVINLCRDMADYKRLLNQINGQFKMRLGS
jgi:biotin operon repressor